MKKKKSYEEILGKAKLVEQTECSGKVALKWFQGIGGQSERELVCFPLHPKGWMQTRVAPKYVSRVEQDRGPREDEVSETRY